VWWLGVFIAPTTKVAVGEVVCRWAHQTVRCASHVTQRLGFDRWSSERWGHRAVRWCTGQSLFTVRCAFWRCSDSARSVHALCTCQPTVEVDRCAWKPLLRWHTGQCGGTPDSAVNYSGVAFPETRRWRVGVDPPWCTEHCPVVHRIVRCARPGQPSVFFCSFLLNPILDFLLVCVEPLAPVELIL
jgi:hypothetical protein